MNKHRILRGELFLLSLDRGLDVEGCLRLSGDTGHVYEALTLLRLETEDGMVGIGGTTTYTEVTVAHSVLESLSPLVPQVVGNPVEEWDGLYRKLRGQFGNCTPQSESVLDMAIWDLRAKRENLPLYRLLGAKNGKHCLPIYVSLPHFDTVEETLQTIDDHIEQDFFAFKLHAWGDLAKDVVLAKEVAKYYAGQPRIKIALDFEQHYSPEEGLEFVTQCGNENFLWFEALIDDTDLLSSKKIAEKSKVPIIPAGLTIHHTHLLEVAAKMKAWDLLRIDLTKCGGFTAVMDVCEMAKRYHLPVELQAWGHEITQLATLHAMLGSACGQYHELPIPVTKYEAFVKGSLLKIDKGYLYAPETPGIGVMMDWNQVREKAIQHVCFEP